MKLVNLLLFLHKILSHCSSCFNSHLNITGLCKICPQISLSCPTCGMLNNSTFQPGANTGGLYSNKPWQMDVRHILDFVKCGFVYFVIDNYSGFICAWAQSGE